MNDWKPGDVAMSTLDGIALKTADGPGGWATASEGIQRIDDADLRRLVVIDPEDHEQVERFAALAYPRYAHLPKVLHIRTIQLQAALRELANPSKPDEPTGLGAVVRDREGDLFVRHSVRDDCERPWRYDDDLVACSRWREIDAVEVLSQGVTA